MSDYDVYIDSAPVDIEVTGAQGPSFGEGGASDVADLTTTGLTTANMLRVKSGGGLEQRTPAQVLSDIGAAATLGSDDNYVTDAEKAMLIGATENATPNTLALRDDDGLLRAIDFRANDGSTQTTYASGAIVMDSISGAYSGAQASVSPPTWTSSGNSWSYQWPAASGMVAMTADASGRPDKLHNGTISGTVAFASGVDATFRTALGGTTVGQAMFTLANPGAITFPRINADNSVSALSASAFRTAAGAAEVGANTDITGITSSTALTLASASGQSILLNAGGTNRATVSSVGITLADNHYLRTNGATGETAHFRFGAANVNNGLAQVVRNSDSAKVLQFGALALNLMGGYDLVGRSTAPALDTAASGEVYRLASSTGNITTSGSIATTSAVILGSFTVGTVPSVSTFARGLIWVSNESGGACVAYSNGTNWKRIYDNANIS